MRLHHRIVQHENIVEMEKMRVRRVQHEHLNELHQLHIIQIQMEIFVFAVWHDHIQVVHEQVHVQHV